MTKQQLILVTCFYLVVLIAVAYFTRAAARRVVGALAGGAVVGWFGMGAIAFGEKMRWWHVPLDSSPSFLALFYLCFVISCSPMYLITWRVARRFGGRGLAVCLIIAAVIGPPRDYLIAAKFPEWMVFAPGIAPVLADAATYVGLVAVGHVVMRWVAGSALGDRLARLTREAA
jgi:hypothetical protein